MIYRTLTDARRRKSVNNVACYEIKSIFNARYKYKFKR